MAIKLTAAARNAACDALVDLVDAGGAGTIEVRVGTIPASPETAPTGGQTLLATLTFSATAFGSASSGTATAAAITSDASIDATGTAGWFRVKSGAGTAIFDGTVTVTGGGGDMTFDSVSFTSGGTCAISAFTVTVPQTA